MCVKKTTLYSGSFRFYYLQSCNQIDFFLAQVVSLFNSDLTQISQNLVAPSVNV